MSQLVILCPGQGAQVVGMGKAWRDASPASAQVFAEADRITGNAFGKPLSELCFAGPDTVLNRTDAAQPAIFTCGVASYRAIWGDPGAAPPPLAYAAGLSLGEYTALVIAGAMSFEDGLRLVTLRGRAMQDAAEAQRGGMVALIGADEAQAQAVCDKVAPAGSGRVLVPANYNAPGQIVLSGEADLCDAAVEAASGMGLKATKLVVAGAFHSPLMAPAADRLASALEGVAIRKPVCPVMANATGLPHGQGEFEGQSFEAGVRAALVRQLTRPVLWSQGCAWLVKQAPAAEFHEVAPGRVLMGLMRRIERAVKVTTHEQPGE